MTKHGNIFVVRYIHLFHQLVIQLTPYYLCRAQIDEIVNNPHNKNTKAAEEEAKRQKTRADQERARADEEERMRKDLQREVAELKELLARRTHISIEH